jgi:ACT domain-containing protein
MNIITILRKMKEKIIQKPKIQISFELKKKLDELGKKGETYDTIIWRIIKNVK